ncbi:MAG: lysophospholipid acyltransferase family protein [Chlorobiota bacterium]
MKTNFTLPSLIRPHLKNFKFLELYDNSFISKYIDSTLKLDIISKYVSELEFEGFEFISNLLRELNISYTISGKDKMRIPSEGRLIIVSNHPLGGLDALVLINAISEIRDDIKVLANDILLNISQLKELFIPVGIFKKTDFKKTALLIEKSMLQEEVLIIFPAGEVSRLKGMKVLDKKWNKTPVKLSKRYNSPILPVFVNNKNSILFYLTSILNKNLSTLLLPRELLKKNNSNINIIIGDMIPPIAFNHYMTDTLQAKLLKKHCYRINTNKKLIFKTQKNVLHPISPKLIKKELNESRVLVELNTLKRVYIVDYQYNKNTINELSRLRELTFRKVNEGTGNISDKDNYDKICNHLVLWSDENVEIIGSYRIGNIREIANKHGYNRIYNSELFEIHESFHDKLNCTLELGRSFLTEPYWRTNSLDYLWQGIGKYLSDHEYIKFLFGAVSISNNYSYYSRCLIVSYYKKWFTKHQENYITAKHPFIIDTITKDRCDNVLVGESYKLDYLNLKKELKRLGYTIPVLLRKYVDICDYGGANFLDFGVDYSFNNSIDCVVLIEVETIKPIYKERYKL